VIQKAVADLQNLGPLPSSSQADPDMLDIWQAQADKVKRPVSDDDAKVLIRLFGPDECFGAMWVLIHAIETAPSWPMLSLLEGLSGYPIEIMKDRCRNSGYKI